MITSDIFLGWVYVRQLHDAKIKPLVESFNTEMLEVYSMACGRVLARAQRQGQRNSFDNQRIPWFFKR